MAEDTAPAATDAPTAPVKGDGTDTFTQDQVNDLIAKEKGKIESRYEGFEHLKAKAQELDRIKDENASELEKAQNKLSKIEKERDTANAALQRFAVAQEKEVPAKLVPLLTGSTKEELEAQADLILANVKAEAPAPDFDGGPREPAPEPESPEQQHNNDVLKLLGIAP